MANTQRDEVGRYKAAAAISSGTDPAPRGPGANIGLSAPGIAPGVSSDPANIPSGGPKPGQDDWGGTRDALMKNATAPIKGPSLGGGSTPAPEAPDYDMGYGVEKEEKKKKKEEGSQYEVHMPYDDDPGSDDPGADPGSGGDDFGGGAPGGGPRDWTPGGAGPALRMMGYGGNEVAGTHSVLMPGGPSYHGRDIPGSGMPGPGAFPGAAEGAEEGAAAGPEGVVAGAVLGLLGSKGGGAPPVLPPL